MRLLAMSQDQLKAFLAALEADTGLQDKLRDAVEGEIDTADETAAVIAIAKEAGFTITAADLLRNEAQNILELSDEDLESMTGGTMRQPAWANIRQDPHRTRLSFGAGCRPAFNTQRGTGVGCIR